jgi:hypothetical protein
VWPNLIEEITAHLSGNVDQALCLLFALKYMAHDCDNQSIVIEDSIRKAFYAFLDANARLNVFMNIFETWSLKLGSLTEPNLLKREIILTFTAWIKLRLPDEIFENLTAECPTLITLVFREIESEDSDNYEAASACAIELLCLSRTHQNW